MKKIKILLINPVIKAEDKPRHFPCGIGLLAAIAKRNKFLVQVFDANAWRPNDEQLMNVFKADSWDVVAIGGLVTTYGYIKKCIQFASEFSPLSKIIAGGGFISAIPSEIMGLLPEIDIGVIGEGVASFPEVLERISGGENDFNDVPGIIWRDKNRQVRINQERPLLENLDSLPFPAYELFPLEIYFKNSSILMSEEAMQAKRRIPMLASFGCPFKCKFCFHLGMGGEIEINDNHVGVNFKKKPVIRNFSPEYLIEHIKFVRKKYGIDFISFFDENFVFLDKFTGGKWTDKFFDLWDKQGFGPDCVKKNVRHTNNNCKGIHWGATAHATLVSPGLLKKMRLRGCVYLDYGLESFDDRILRSIGKGANAKANEEAIKWSIEAGIRPIPNQIIGFPDEDFSSIKANVLAWQRLGIKSSPFFATPYPGSEWFYEYKDKILAQYNHKLEDFLLSLGEATRISAVISRNFNAVELLGLRDLMVNHDLKRIEEYEKTKGKNIFKC